MIGKGRLHIEAGDRTITRMGKLFLLGLLAAAGDPILLYLVFRAWGGWVLLALLLLPPLVGGWLVSAASKRVEARSAAVGAPAAPLGEQMLLVSARLLFWYPGPLSTVLGVLLLIPGARRLMQRWALRRLQKAVSSGAVAVASHAQGVVFTSAPGVARGDADVAPAGPLKRAAGRVVDSEATLPSPTGDK